MIESIWRILYKMVKPYGCFLQVEGVVESALQKTCKVRDKDARCIYMKLDEFHSQRSIDII